MSLKEKISHKHKLAESHSHNVSILSGKMSAAHYVNHLRSMLGVYAAIENRIKLPDGMSRRGRIHDDIIELIDIVDSRSESDEDVRSASKISKRYADYIASLEEQDVMPHVYVNYMALLFGGQIIKNKIPGSGRFYDFENPQDHVSYIRSLQKDDWAEEANIGFDHIISIYDELQEFFRRDSK